MIHESELAEWVTCDIRANAHLAAEDRARLEIQIGRLKAQTQSKQMDTLVIKRKDAQKRLTALDSMIRKLFEDRFAGNIPEKMFKKLTFEYEAEQTRLEADVDSYKTEISAIENERGDVNTWLEMLVSYVDLCTLDRSVVVHLIDSIVIPEPYEENGITTRDIKINYKFIGCLGEALLLPS